MALDIDWCQSHGKLFDIHVNKTIRESEGYDGRFCTRFYENIYQYQNIHVTLF